MCFMLWKSGKLNWTLGDKRLKLRLFYLNRKKALNEWDAKGNKIKREFADEQEMLIVDIQRRV